MLNRAKRDIKPIRLIELIDFIKENSGKNRSGKKIGKLLDVPFSTHTNSSLESIAISPRESFLMPKKDVQFNPIVTKNRRNSIAP